MTGPDQIKQLERETKELASPLRLRLRVDRKQAVGVRVREMDSAFEITINPGRYRSQQKWDSMVEWLKREVG